MGGRTRGVPAGPWRLCPSRAIGVPGPAALGRSDRASATCSSGHPGSRGRKTEAAPTESCPARGLRPARLVTNCAVVPVSKWSRGGVVTSLSSQGDSVLAFGSRVPDLDGKYCIVFRCPIIPNINGSYPSLLWFYSEFLAPKSPLDTKSRC